MTKYTPSKEMIEKAVAESVNLTQAMRMLGIVPTGSNFTTMKKRVIKYDISIEHFTGQAHMKGKPALNRKDPSHYLKRTGERINRDPLLRALLNMGMSYVCVKCGLQEEWQGEKITLHIDHIDGDKCNNEIENLRFLCPNCHSQTATWGGKRFKKQNKCLDCGKDITNQAKRCGLCSYAVPRQRNNPSKVRTPRKKKEFLCSLCGEPTKTRATCCLTCSHKKAERIDWPDKETLENMVRYSNFLQVSKLLGVSDNAVRKRLKKYENGM